MKEKEYFPEQLTGAITMILSVVVVGVGGALVSKYHALWAYLVLIALIIGAVLLFIVGINLYVHEINFDNLRNRFRRAICKTGKAESETKKEFNPLYVITYHERDQREKTLLYTFQYWCKRDGLAIRDEFEKAKTYLDEEETSILLAYIKEEEAHDEELRKFKDKCKSFANRLDDEQ